MLFIKTFTSKGAECGLFKREHCRFQRTLQRPGQIRKRDLIQSCEINLTCFVHTNIALKNQSLYLFMETWKFHN